MNHEALTLLELLRETHIFTEKLLQMLPWQHVKMSIMISLKFIFGVLSHISSVFSCNLAVQSSIKQYVVDREHSGFKHSFYR